MVEVIGLGRHKDTPRKRKIKQRGLVTVPRLSDVKGKRIRMSDGRGNPY